MFRKPKNKSAIRQRTQNDDDHDTSHEEPAKEVASTSGPTPAFDTGDDDDDIEGPPIIVPKKSALLSFDVADDEEEKDEFKLKKDRKKVRDAKRMRKLEVAAEKCKLEPKMEPVDDLQIKVVNNTMKREMLSDEEGDENNDLGHSFIPKGQRQFRREEDVSRETSIKPSNVRDHNIPDSKAVYEARKRRERLRMQGSDGVIPLDDDQKIRDKGARQRLIREDDNDDSDEDTEKFYSSKEAALEEDIRRREQQTQFLEHEENAADGDSDEEVERWEKQQIMKAVGLSTIGQAREDYERTAAFFQNAKKQEEERTQPIEMDVEMDLDEPSSYTVSSKPGAEPADCQVSMADILSKLALRLRDREESLNSLKQNMTKIQGTIDENKEHITAAVAGMANNLAGRYKMYQEMKLYVRSLLDCLNEKYGEINVLTERRRNVDKTRTSRLIARRRRDMLDLYDECKAAAAGKNVAGIRVGEHATRAAEREARKSRRRRERENDLAGLGHEEGLSTDDEETMAQCVADKEEKEAKANAISEIFADAHEEYGSVRPVLRRLINWLAVDPKNFQDAYVHMCIPRLISPFVKLELGLSDNSNFRLEDQKWYSDALLAGVQTDIAAEHPVIVSIIPAIVEKVVVPFLTDVVINEWDPMSLKQTRNLASLIDKCISEYPTLNEKSKNLAALVKAIQQRAQECINEDLFIPMYPKTAIENPNTGCKNFLDRQFWVSIKLARSLSLFSGLLSVYTMHQLVFDGILSRSCGLALQMGSFSDPGVIAKVRAIIADTRGEWMSYMVADSMRSFIGILSTISENFESSNKDFSRQTRRFVERLKNAE